MKRAFLLILVLGIPLAAFGHGSDSRLVSKLSICEKMKANRDRIAQTRSNDQISNRCRQALDQVDECYKAREATKNDTDKLRSLGVSPQEGERQTGLNGLGVHSAASLNMGRERYNRNSEMCQAIRENVQKQCRADGHVLEREHDRNHKEYQNLRDTNQTLAQEHSSTMMQLQKQMRANAEAEKAAAQGLADESACNEGYEDIYTAYAAGANNSLQLAAASGGLPSNQTLNSAPTGDSSQKSAISGDSGYTERLTEKAVELAHKGVMPVLEQGLPAVEQAALKSTAAVFPVATAVHDDLPGAAAGAAQLVGDVVGKPGLSSLGVGAGVFSAVYFPADPTFMRCDQIYTDPVQAARAGNCPIQTAAGGMSTQSAVRILSSD